MKFTLYSKLVGGTRNKKIKDSEDFQYLYEKAITLFEKDTKRERDYFIVEHGIKATKIQKQIVL